MSLGPLHADTQAQKPSKDDYTTAGPWQRALLSLAQLRTRPKHQYLIDGLLPMLGLIILHGDPGSLKTFIALMMALCIAAGVPFFGRAVAQRRVVYVALEGQSGFYARIAAWLTRHPQAAKAIEENFRVIVVPLNLFTAGRLTVEGRRVLDGLIGGLREFAPGFIIIDTLARALGEGDENKNVDMAVIVQALQELERELSAATLIIHHPAKNASGKPTPRGASNLPAAADAIFFTKRTAEGTTLKNTKQKDGEEAEDMHFVAERVTLSGDAGQPETSLVLSLACEARRAPVPVTPAKPRKTEQAILAALAGASAPVRAADLAEAALGTRRASGAFNEALKALVEAGQIAKTGDPATYALRGASLLPLLPHAA